MQIVLFISLITKVSRLLVHLHTISPSISPTWEVSFTLSRETEPKNSLAPSHLGNCTEPVQGPNRALTPPVLLDPSVRDEVGFQV